jgi:hypothetical protein
VRLTFCSGLSIANGINNSDFDLTVQQLMYVLLWRSSLNLRGIQHGPAIPGIPQKDPTHDMGPLLHWTIEIDPMSEEFRPICQLLLLAIELKIAVVSYFPIVPAEFHEIPRHLQFSYTGAILTDTLPLKEHGSINTPASWVKHRVGNTILITAVSQAGFAPGSTIVQVAGQTRRPIADGYFVIVLPVGRYPAKGLRDEYFAVEWLQPHCRFFIATKEIITVVPDPRFHILSDIYNPENTNKMVNSLRSHSKCDCKIWLFDGVLDQLPSGMEVEILPLFWPTFMPLLSNSVSCFQAARFAFLDLLIPLEVEHILLVDARVVLHRDVSVFKPLELDGAVCAAPLISSSRRKAHYWNRHDFLLARFGRPFHSTAIVWVDLVRWREVSASEKYRRLLIAGCAVRQRIIRMDDDLFNLLQLDVQVVTLPEETAFCSKYSHASLAGKAFSLVHCEFATKAND